MKASIDLLFEVNINTVVVHPINGVFITKEQIAECDFSFVKTHLNTSESWSSQIQHSVFNCTGVENIYLSDTIHVESFLPNIISNNAVFSVFMIAFIYEDVHRKGNFWVHSVEELETLALFHPLVKDIVNKALIFKSESSAQVLSAFC